jgi:hypothetical protein
MLQTNEIAAFLARQPYIVQPLKTLAVLGIEDCWIGAGLLRNAVWDHLHGLRLGPVPGSDIDVVYCNPADVNPATDLAIQHWLCTAAPDVPWSVHNQARMHGPNGDPPYRNVADAIRCWPETATAIAARLENGRFEVLAPHGLDDLVGLIVRPTPAFAAKIGVYRLRQASKKWKERWPKLTFVSA